LQHMQLRITSSVLVQLFCNSAPHHCSRISMPAADLKLQRVWTHPCPWIHQRPEPKQTKPSPPDSVITMGACATCSVCGHIPGHGYINALSRNKPSTRTKHPKQNPHLPTASSLWVRVQLAARTSTPCDLVFVLRLTTHQSAPTGLLRVCRCLFWAKGVDRLNPLRLLYVCD